MLCALSASRQAASTATARGLVRVARRRLTSESTTPSPIPKKKSRVFRNILLATATVTGGFYIGSTFVAFNNMRYYDFFSDSVPLGQVFIEYGESRHWDTLTAKQVLESGKQAIVRLQRAVSNKLRGVSESSETQNVVEPSKDHRERLKSVAANLRTNFQKGGQVGSVARHQAAQFSEGVDELVRKAEKALADNPVVLPPEASAAPPQPDEPQPSAIPSPVPNSDTSLPNSSNSNAPVYDAPLPIGFEPPPGYSKPSSPKKNVDNSTAKAVETPITLPLVAPAILESGASEPVIAHLASTIDNLASFLNSNPAAAKAQDVLETAKGDLTELSARIERIREEQQGLLEEKLDEQAREYTVKLLELELGTQDKLESQQEGFNQYFEEEKVKFVKAYREKLDQELRTQTDLINERLRTEVIAQGIEMQRRWIREVKVRVEQERGGRLAKLDELSANIKRLERIAFDNSSYLDENIRVHALWSAVRALANIVDAPVRKPFRDELRVLRHITAAKEEPLITAALDSLERTDISDIGIDPLADLASWFSTSVAPHVTSVALVPDQNAGLLSHLASHLLSSFRFKRHGLVPGSDVLSVLARAEYYMNEQDLDSATRELNQLKGTAKVLLSDWLDAARRRLEVLQALEIIQAQATLASLNIV